MRAFIFKTVGVLAFAALGLGLTGCAGRCFGSTCCDAWESYEPCDLIEGHPPGCCRGNNRLCR